MEKAAKANKGVDVISRITKNIIDRGLAGLGYRLEKTSRHNDLKLITQAYQENMEVGPDNLRVKLKRVEDGGEFEWPNIIALNQAVASLLKGETLISNIGAGTGTFEWFVSVDKSVKLVASEFDKDCVAWCKQHRQRDNITYTCLTMKQLKKKYRKFDLAVAIEVIEHVADFAGFLDEFSLLADRAIITTPNKLRSRDSNTVGPPNYYQHVREWSAGEFYWVLRNYFEVVDLYAMPDVFLPELEKINVLSAMTPLVADCRNKHK